LSIQKLNGTTLQAWRKFSAFQVFGDYVPLAGFRIVVGVGSQPDVIERMLEDRAQQAETLDPTLARASLRAGLGLVSSGLVTFVYATAHDALAVIRPDAVGRAGTPLEIHNVLLARYSARLSLLVGREIPAEARIYEFPDLTVIRRALCALQTEVEDSALLRSSLWLGAQLRGRGQPFHPSMVETLEDQNTLLSSNGVDADALPPWWWRGIAAAMQSDGTVEIFDELPTGDAFGDLVPED
jgi:hypothetical protein